MACVVPAKYDDACNGLSKHPLITTVLSTWKNTTKSSRYYVTYLASRVLLYSAVDLEEHTDSEKWQQS
jgi:hypothetical protein